MQQNIAAAPLRKRLTPGHEGIACNTFRVVHGDFSLHEAEKGDFRLPATNQYPESNEESVTRALAGPGLRWTKL